MRRDATCSLGDIEASAPSMSKPVTIKDIALEVGVSTSAVSAVLGRGVPSTVRVSSYTRKRILETAERLRYRPNQIARSLRGKNTNVVGFYAASGCLNPMTPFTLQLIGGLHLGCAESRKDLLLQRLCYERLTGEVDCRNIDGLVVYSQPDDPLLAMMALGDLPVVGVVNSLPGVPCVVADDACSSRMIVEHLWERGHRSAIYVVGASSGVSAVRRHRAFMECAEEWGMRVRDVHSTPGAVPFAQGAMDWIDEVGLDRSTAAVCCDDYTAYQLLIECDRRRMRVPDDLAVVGFDGTASLWPMSWRLTTVQVPWEEAMRTAVNLLLVALDGDDLPAETTVPVALTIGDTT
jgi:DNA-binding LacI/PurR family transcriptional regulator